MGKVVYNACYGGFRLSDAALKRYNELTGGDVEGGGRSLDRHDPVLVQVVEEMGDAASGGFSALCIEYLPSGTSYRIDEYDGYERVETPDSYEWKVVP